MNRRLEGSTWRVGGGVEVETVERLLGLARE